MPEFFTSFIIAHPFLMALLISPALGAILPDLLSFTKWKSWDDALTFKPSLLLLRVGQSIVSANVGAFATTGIVAGAGAVAFMLVWAISLLF